MEIENDLKTISTWLSRFAWFARLVGARKLVWKVKHEAALEIVRRCHLNVLHRMRYLASAVEDWEQGTQVAANLAFQICTECRKTLGGLLELRDNDLHCCIKLLEKANGTNGDEDKVSTWVRSEPFDDRPAEQTLSDAHLIKTNSVWSAFYGRFDGRYHWRQTHCFACNDLTKHEEFQCDRINWQRYYKSTLAFPIRYPIDSQGVEFDYIGFLAFDSPKVGAFRGLPDIFDYRDRPTEYRDSLEASTAFHIGAMFADILGTFLRGAYEQHAEKRSNANG